jgi:putative ABC transport system permease protein
MLSNDIKIALRNLRTHRFYTLLNIVGLALGMSACLTVILIIRDQLGYEKFHPATERTYRILSQAYTTDPGGRAKFATSPYPLGETLTSDFAGVEKTVRLVRGIDGQEATTASGVTLTIDGYFTEPSFFQVFGFQLETGNAATALAEPNCIVLEKRAAARFFGNQDPMGQILTIKDWGTFRVTGVALPSPGKSHIGFECLASVSTLVAVEQRYKPEEADNKILGNWNNRYSSLNYVVLHPGQTKTNLEAALSVVSEKHTPLDDKGEHLHLFAQNLGQVTPAPELLGNEIGFGLPWFFIWGLSAFVLLLIIFPCLNYVNLSVARAWARAKEVGVRKVVGAQMSDVRRLFLAESILTAFFALAGAWVMHLAINHFIETKILSEFNMRGSQPISLRADAVSWVAFVVFGLLVGLFSGWLPAQRLAKMRPTAAIRDGLGQRSGGAVARFGWRKVMTVGQFAISLIFMIVVAALWGQLRYLAVVDYGFEKENLLAFDAKGNDPKLLAEEISRDHRVKGVTRSTIIIASNSLQVGDIQRERGGERTSIHQLGADAQFVPVMGLQMAAGENFSPDFRPEPERHILINEKAVSLFQFGSPAEAIGQTLWLNDTTPVTIRGVLRDFNYRPLKEAVQPFVLRFAPQHSHNLYVRLQPGDPKPALAALGAIWRKIDPSNPFEAEFMETRMQNAYRDIEIMNAVLGFFALLGLSLACLGLLGMVTYTTSTKVKEIGIRKVLGASAWQVALFISRHFLWLLAIAVAIALPLGHFLASQILNLFASRVALSGLLLGTCVLGLLGLGLLAIGVQTIRAAMANPVKSLRSE